MWSKPLSNRHLSLLLQNPSRINFIHPRVWRDANIGMGGLAVVKEEFLRRIVNQRRKYFYEEPKVFKEEVIK